jgi:hypothetical protein
MLTAALFAAAGAAAAQDGSSHRDDKKAEAQFFGMRASEGISIDQDVYDKAARQWRTFPTGEVVGGLVRLRPSLVTGVMGTVWTPIGPSPIFQGTSQVNGRVSAIALNPNNPNVIYQGASGGGVWRTIDGGATWSPLYDQQVSLGVGEPSAIAIDPSNTNTIYVGTSARFVLNISKGILKSTDGGGSWIVLGDGFPAGNTGNADNLFAGNSINVIIVDPANSNVLYLAASSGLYRSTDGGRNWTLGTNGSGDARSLALDTTSPAGSRRLYAGADGSGIRQSTNGGQTWTQILSTATPAVAASLPASSTIGHVLVDLAPPTSPPNPGGIQVLYASMEGVCTAPSCGVADPLGLFRSTDQGATWNRQTSTGIPGTNGQAWYSFSMSVDPASPGDGSNDIIYLGAVGAAKSTDSGNNFAGVGPGIHVDSHSMWVFARQPSPTPSIVFTGNDGGIWKSTDGGATWSGTGGPAPTINAGGLQTALFYNLDIKNDATASVTEGSTQDNGTDRRTAGLVWTDTQGGDGWDIAFDAVTTNNAYNSSGFWSPAPCTRVWKSTNSGASFPTDVTPWGAGPTDQGCYLASVNADPSMADVIYASGSQNLWQTQNGGGSWRIILNQGFTQVKVARANSNIVVASTAFQVLVSTNALAPAGVAFTNITRNLPPRPISRVELDPNDPTVIFAVLSGFNAQTPGQPGHVFRTTIGGTAWTNISPALDVPFNAIVLDGVPAPSTIYVGTDLGVMRSVDDGASWSVLDDIHFPNVPVTDLAINRQARVLRASTFGRGAFEFAQPSDAVIAVNAENGLQFESCTGSTGRLTLQVFNVGTQDLVINSVQRLFGSSGFSVLPNPSTPLVISPNAEVDFTVQYTPTGLGAESAQIRISSSDPGAPSFDLMATANGTPQVPDIRVTGSTDFGAVCAGAVAEKTVSVCNVGRCDLHIVSASFVPPCPDFTIVHNPFPATISHDACVGLTIRFTPTSPGPKSCNLVVTSDDSDSPILGLTVTANTPTAAIGVPPDVAFPPTVIQNIGPCTSFRPFPISNTGTCNLTITNITIGGTDQGDYSLVGLPSFPIILEPGHVVGGGDLKIAFEPTEVDRDRVATVNVTYVSDPITSATTTVSRNLCGEGTRTGVRILVTAHGVPAPLVKMIKVRRLNANAQNPELNTVSVEMNLAPQTVVPSPPCPQFQYHREIGAASSADRLLAGVYDVTATVQLDGRMVSKSVGFDVRTCDFHTLVIDLDANPAAIASEPAPDSDGDHAVVSATRLGKIHPNPFRGRVTVGFNLVDDRPTSVEVFDARGALVRTLVRGSVPSGRYEIDWDGHDSAGRPAPKGVYFFRFNAGKVLQTKKAVLL